MAKNNIERPVHGVLCECNWGGLEVSITDGADFLHWRTNYGEPGKWHKATIYYTLDGRAYFKARGSRIHLENVMRV